MSRQIWRGITGVRGNAYWKAYQRLRRIENVAAGLTWEGKERKRVIRFDLAGLSRNKRKVITNRDRRQRLAANNLKTKGTV